MSTSEALKLVTQRALELEEKFSRDYPALYKNISNTGLLDTQSIPADSTTDLSPNLTTTQQLASQITEEEHASVLDKARSIVLLPAGNLDREVSLYLEQQLSEILDFAITTKLEDHTLPYTHATVQALPHRKRTPTDQATAHNYQYAAFSNKRSFFGWTHIGHGSTIDGFEAEKYGVSVPLHLLANWQNQAETLSKWYAYRKVVVINPIELTAVVCRITDNFPLSTGKYQLGASPEVIIEGKCWSPQAQGKILLFFVDDSNAAVPLGPISLQFQRK